MKLIYKWCICAVALFATELLFPQYFYVGGGIAATLIAATVLWAINLLLRPILQIISIPITLITFGFFSLLINAWMVKLAAAVLPWFIISNFWMCLFTAVLISFGNSFFLRTRKFDM